MIVSYVFIDPVRGPFLEMRLLLGYLLHYQYVYQVFPGSRVRAEISPRSVILCRHGLAQQLIRIVFRGKFDDIAPGFALSPGENLEYCALPNAASADNYPFRSETDPIICF